MIKTLTINPDDFNTLNNLGIAFFETERFEESMTSFQKALDIQPNFADVWNNLGTVFQKLNLSTNKKNKIKYDIC